ncbi:MAG: S53 family peptidase [Candidatus Bathyarchaeia archaeon]
MTRLPIAAIMILIVSFVMVSGIAAPNSSPASLVRPMAGNPKDMVASDCSVPSSNQMQATTQTSTTTNTKLPGAVAPAVLNHTVTMIRSMSTSFVLHMEVVFKMQNPDKFSKCLAAISDPSSPEYGHFLNATTLAPFVENPIQKALVKAFLTAKGFNVTDGASPLVLNVLGSTGVVQNAFQVHVNFYETTKNLAFYSADTDPTLPQPITNLVQYIAGLENYTTVKPAETPCSGPYCPQGIQIGYSISTLISSGYTGSGQKVGVVDVPGDPHSQTAINTFDTQYGLPATTLDIIYPDGTPTSWNPGWASEAAMDIEAVHSVAPGAKIVLAYDKVDPMNGVDYVASNGLASVISNSWTYGCVSPISCSDIQLDSTFSGLVSSVDSRLAVDAALGVTILFASADEGAKPDGTTFGTEFPASDPNVLAVGATNLVLNGCGTKTCTGYGSETGAYISGGGYSGYFSEPSWQTSTIGSTSAHCTTGHLHLTCRAVPDISMLGFDPAFWVYSTASDMCGTVLITKPGWFGCAGTSLSTPLWAGFIAVALQVKGGGQFGIIAPLLYSLGAGTHYPTLFHDVTAGSNDYSAGTSWDPVTGWGTPIGIYLALAMGPNFTVTNSGGIIVDQGSSGSTQVTVTLHSGPVQPVALACTGGLPLWSYCSFNPSSAVPSYTSTLTISSEPSTPAGSYNVIVNGTFGIVTNSTNFNLVVNQHQQSCTLISLPSMYNCPLAFVRGWNLVSLPVTPVANSTFPNAVDGIFGSNPQFGFMSNVTSVFAYTAGTWQGCTVTKQVSGLNTKYTCTGALKNMVDGKGYWVYAKAAFTLNNPNNLAPTWGGLVGSVIPPTSTPPTYSLTAGWNLVGYKPQPDPSVSETVSTYLTSLPGSSYDPDNVWVYDSASAQWARGTSTTLNPGQTFWIFMLTPATLRP